MGAGAIFSIWNIYGYEYMEWSEEHFSCRYYLLIPVFEKIAEEWIHIKIDKRVDMNGMLGRLLEK